MAKKKQKTTIKGKRPANQLKDNQDTKDIPENPKKNKVSKTNKSLHKGETDPLQSPVQYQPSTTPIQHKSLSILQKILIISIIVITVMLIYGLFNASKGPRQSYAETHTKKTTPTEPAEGRFDSVQSSALAVKDSYETELNQQAEGLHQIKPASGGIAKTKLADIKKPDGTFLPSEPISLKVAQTYYQQKEFKKAYALYYQLLNRISAGSKDELWCDFLLFKIALCMDKTGDIQQAERLLITVAQSRSPALRVVARYFQCATQMQRKKYLNAVTKAYQIIALTEVINYDKDWALMLNHHCHFLVSESITKNVISLRDADKDLPPKLWSSFLELDPFINLEEEQIRSFLNSGVEELNKALLGPKIQKLESQDAARWLIICDGAPIDELLARFAANAGIQIHWAGQSPAPDETRLRRGDNIQQSETMKEAIRKRPVRLYLSAATPQQLVTIAAGSVGLIARMDNQNTMTIKDPTVYYSLSEHINMLAQEAVSLWQKLLLTTHTEERIPNIHFALGLLQAQIENLPEAIAEFKLIANRFSQSSLAPYALLHSSKLKTILRDYSSAREDLKYLVEQYPDTDFSDRACLYLADATMKAGFYSEAARLYRKVYNIGLSLESQTKSAIGAGRCYYELKDYEAAAKWLTRYINFAHNQTDNNYYIAWFLLGKSYMAMDKFQQACNAFQFVLKGQVSKQIYIQTISELAKAHIQREQFIEAINILENTHPWQFTQEEYINILLAKANILRSIGLIDKAIATISDRAEFLPDPQLKAKILYELAKCYVAKEDLENACKSLIEILVLIKPGPFANEVSYELANVCFKLGQFSQTISICLQILNSDPQVQTKQKTQQLLAEVYKEQKNYDKAIGALLGQINDTSVKNSKINPEKHNRQSGVTIQ